MPAPKARSKGSMRRLAAARDPVDGVEIPQPIYTDFYYSMPPEDEPSDALTYEEVVELVGAGVISESTSVWAESDDVKMEDWKEFGACKKEFGFPVRDGGTVCGWLEKKASFRQPWSKVYCVLYPGSTPPRIGEYTAVNSMEEFATIDLGSCSAVRSSTVETADPTEFVVVSTDMGTVRLRAPNDEAKALWLEALAVFASAQPKGKRERTYSTALSKTGAGTTGNAVLNGMDCIASGHGGLEDLVAALDEEKVIFGMMKFSLGDGKFARDKFVYLHFNGHACKGMKKAKDNSKKESTVKAMGGAHTEMNFERQEDISIDVIVDHCLRYLVIDGGTYNKAQMKEVIESQMEKKDTGKIGTATELGLDPRDDFMSVLEQVRAEQSKFNWILANPDPNAPSFHEAGTGSLPEMRDYLQPDLVLYGLVRMSFGSGRFRRTKWVFIHWSGPQVPMVKRGQWNSVSHSMDQLLSSFGRYHLEMTSVTHIEDTDPVNVIEKIKEIIVSDGDDEDLFSLGAYLEALREEREAVCEELHVVDTGPWSFDETVAKIRQEDGPINWMLCAVP